MDVIVFVFLFFVCAFFVCFVRVGGGGGGGGGGGRSSAVANTNNLLECSCNVCYVLTGRLI